mgnify:CR=1 FL=1
MTAVQWLCLIVSFHFNSHAHVERDAAIKDNIGAETHFNSHAHVERDLYAFICSTAFVISTHTLTWSVTFVSCKLHINIVISTHTLTWSVTQA